MNATFDLSDYISAGCVCDMDMKTYAGIHCHLQVKGVIALGASVLHSRYRHSKDDLAHCLLCVCAFCKNPGLIVVILDPRLTKQVSMETQFAS
jgi:hypothetical protein